MERSLSSDEFVAGVLTTGAGERRYKLFRPGARPPAGQRSLVVMLHGCTQDADDIARGTRLNDAAARDGFVVLYPEQGLTAHPQKCWNWFLASHSVRDAGESAILDALTRQVIADEGIDPRRVFLAGLSAGAGMAANLAVAYPERFTALALHSGLPAGAATDVMAALAAMKDGAARADELGAAAFKAMGSRARVIPMIAIHGALDAVVSPKNVDATFRQWAVTNALAAGVTAPAPTVVAAPTGLAHAEALHGERVTLPGGRGIAEAWRCDGVGHAWSGGAGTGTFTAPDGPDATGLMLDFFARHRQG